MKLAHPGLAYFLSTVQGDSYLLISTNKVTAHTWYPFDIFVVIMMATATEDMDTAAEPIMAESEPKEEAPPLEPSASLVDTKAEHIDQ